MLKIKLLHAAVYSVKQDNGSLNEGVTIRYFDCGFQPNEKERQNSIGFPVAKASLPKALWPVIQQAGLDCVYEASFTLSQTATGTMIKITGVKPIK